MFRRVYVPYVTNMMYQETLIVKLLLVLLLFYWFKNVHFLFILFIYTIVYFV